MFNYNDSWYNVWSDHQQKMEGSNITLTWGVQGCFKAQLTEMIQTHVYIQKPYLLWIRDRHTTKFLHVFKIHNNIAYNIKCDMYQSDILQVLLGVIAYVQRRMKENRQEHHQEGEHRVGTAKKMGGMSRNVLEKKGGGEMYNARMVVYGCNSVTMKARPMSQFIRRDHKL